LTENQKCYMQIFYYFTTTEDLVEISVKFRKSIGEFSVKFDMFSKSPREILRFLHDLGWYLPVSNCQLTWSGVTGSNGFTEVARRRPNSCRSQAGEHHAGRPDPVSVPGQGH